jgi:16S rRNA (guanine(966)-N(2))-methyltransferase RsmD
LRVITGTAGGVRLETPADMAVRPTTDKVKEALFSSVQFEIEGSDVLDLFAGSGQLGIEALSRGAQQVVFVDKSRVSLNLVKKNLDRCGFKAQIVNSDSLQYLGQACEKFDIAFLDPPYSVGLLQKALPLVSEKMKKNGVIIAESPFKEELPGELKNNYRLVKQKKYGSMKLSFYRYEEKG